MCARKMNFSAVLRRGCISVTRRPKGLPFFVRRLAGSVLAKLNKVLRFVTLVLKTHAQSKGLLYRRKVSVGVMRRESISAPRRRKGLLVLLPLSIFRLANLFGSSQTFLVVEEVSFWLLSNFFHSSPRRSCTKHISKSASVCHFGSKNAHAVGLAESSRSPLAIDPKTVFGKPPEVFFCDCSRDISRRISRNFPGRPVARDFPVAGTCVKAQCGPPLLT